MLIKYKIMMEKINVLKYNKTFLFHRNLIIINSINNEYINYYFLVNINLFTYFIFLNNIYLNQIINCYLLI